MDAGKEVMMAFRPISLAISATAIFAFVPAGVGNGEEVTLSLKGGSFTIIGELMAAPTGSFVVKSEKFGVMAVEASKFECVGTSCPHSYPAALTIHGSNTIGAQLMPNTIERFAEIEGYLVEKVLGSDPEEVVYKLSQKEGGSDAVSIELQSHGSNTAPPDLLNGKAQIGEMSRPIKPEELKAIADAGLKLSTHVFALDAVVVFVSPQNSVKALSLDQIGKMFAGEIKDWSEVGRSPGKINLYARDAKSGTYDTFDNLVLKPRHLKISAEAKRFESSPELSDETARDPNGIGFAGFAYIRNAKALAISSDCGIVSPPDVFSVKTEEYPLSRRLFLHNVDSTPPIGNKLLSFALDDQAQDTISEAGFVNQRLDAQSFEQQTGRLAPALLVADKDFSFSYMRELVNGLKNAARLSVNFRFKRNAVILDEKARQDIPRLARFLRSDPKVTEVFLIGFADNAGTFDANRAVAFNRANNVKSALVAEGVPANQITTRAYGSLLPVGCNSTEAGRESNRRVEVWVKSE
jgi:phosphate transport system substrate-binding protein